MDTSVIVATEHDSTVRVYVGHPSNGGMQQCAQLTTQRAIDPHDLADIAVAMATQFGWVIANGTTKEKLALPPATQKPKTAHTSTREMQKIECPQCHYVTSRKHMRGHLTRHHHWSKPRISTLLRRAPEIGTEPAPAPVSLQVQPEPETIASYSQRGQQHVPCPAGCGYVGLRKNMATHLMGSKHKWERTKANAAARGALEASTPAVTKANRDSWPRGKAGEQHLAANVFPLVLAYLAEHGEASTAEVAKHMDVDQSRATAWLRTLSAQRKVVRTGEPTNQPHTYALASETAP